MSTQLLAPQPYGFYENGSAGIEGSHVESVRVKTPLDRSHGVDCEAAVLLHGSVLDREELRVFRYELNSDLSELSGAIRSAFEPDGPTDTGGMLQFDHGIDGLVFH